MEAGRIFYIFKPFFCTILCHIFSSAKFEFKKIFTACKDYYSENSLRKKFFVRNSFCVFKFMVHLFPVRKYFIILDVHSKLKEVSIHSAVVNKHSIRELKYPQPL